MHAVVQNMLLAGQDLGKPQAAQERIARDGLSYTHEEFAEWYGKDADNMWACAAVIVHDYTFAQLCKDAYRYAGQIEQLLKDTQAELAQTQAELASQTAAAMAANSMAQRAKDSWTEASGVMAGHLLTIEKLQAEGEKLQAEGLKHEKALEASEAARFEAETSSDELRSVLSRLCCLETETLCSICRSKCRES